MSKQSPTPVIRTCVLAAGLSSRFGASKLTKNLHGKALVQHALIAAQQISRGSVALVVGGDERNVSLAAGDLCDQIVLNSQYKQGIGSSIAAGIAALQDGADAILVLLADQPLVTAGHLRNICNAWSGADDEIVATSFDGIQSPPVLFPCASFRRLCELRGDQGAKRVLTSGEFVVKSVDCDRARYDVDTPEDLEALRRD